MSTDLVGNEDRFNPNHGEDGRFTGGGIDFGDASSASIFKHHSKMSSGWKKLLTASEAEHVKDYTDNNFEEYNSLHRHGKVTGRYSSKSDYEHKSKILDKALDKAFLHKKTVVYRGIKDIHSLGHDHKKLKGAILRDKAYFSASLSKDVAEEFVHKKPHGAIFRISAPKGAKGASVHGLTLNKTEHEVLFHRNTAIKIVGHGKDKKGRTIIHAMMLP